VHLLLITKTNFTDLSQLTPAMHQEFFELVNWAIQEYSVAGGAFCFRFGDSNYSAGTVAHLHAQFIVPALTGPDYEPVRFKIGKDKDKLSHDVLE
jgi:diadenosine tetraphosphate (Ap4A) HIT family hydrolase